MLANRALAALILAACAAALGPAAARQSAGALAGEVQPWIAIEESKLVPGDPAHGQYFGQAVAVSGDTAVVGAPGDEPDGAAHVFVRSGTGWIQQQKLTAGDATFNFGEDVAISGDRIVVGALSQGVYVFERLGAHWDEQAKILNPSRTSAMPLAIASPCRGTRSWSAMNETSGSRAPPTSS